MTTTTSPIAPTADATDRDWPSMARGLVPALAELAPQHDRDGTFVAPGIGILRDAGILGMAVPVDLGGHDTRVAEVSRTLAEIARGCPSTALVAAMHLHTTLTAAWRNRRDGAMAGVLSAAAGGALVASTGGSDLTRPTGWARRAEGGFRVGGRKRYVSGAPGAAVVSAWFPYDDPEDGPVCLGIGIRPAADGVRIDETWDTAGMRGTGSHDLVVDDVFVPDAQVTARRAAGRVDGPLVIMLTHFAYSVSGVYAGLAAAARDAAVDALAGSGRRVGTPEVQRAVGDCEQLVAAAEWTLAGALARTGDDPAPDLAGLATALLAKRAVLDAATAAVDRAVEAVGGAAYFRSSPLERLARDVRAAAHHPLTPEATLRFAGRLALGMDASAV